MEDRAGKREEDAVLRVTGPLQAIKNGPCPRNTNVLRSVHMRSTDRHLIRLGLSPAAAAAYAALVERGASGVADLAKATGKYRPAVYAALAELAERKLTTTSRKGRRLVYAAQSPSLLRQVLDAQQEKLGAVIADLEEIHGRNGSRPKLTMYEGRRGFGAAYERIIRALPKGGIIRRIESPGDDHGKIRRYYPPFYHERAGMKGDIDKLVITSARIAAARRKNLNRTVRAVPETISPLDQQVTLLIAGNFAAVFDYETETAFVIENKRLASLMETLFKLGWDRLR